ALMPGASAGQLGTGSLRGPEASLHPAHPAALATTLPEGTMLSRGFSGRAGRTIATDYVRAASAPDAPRPAPYPIQRALTAPMRAAALKSGDVQRMQAWAGQSAALARAEPAAALIARLWRGAQARLWRGGAWPPLLWPEVARAPQNHEPDRRDDDQRGHENSRSGQHEHACLPGSPFALSGLGRWRMLAHPRPWFEPPRRARIVAFGRRPGELE